MGFLCHDRVILRRDKVWPRQGILGRDRVFSCSDRVWGKGQESLRRDREFDVMTELSENYVVTWYTLWRDREFQDMRSSMSRHSVLCGDNEARHCVSTRLCAHNRDTLS